MASKIKDNSPSGSDLDDWTLVSPPHSSSSSPSTPDREETSAPDANSSSNSSLEQIGEDGLTEVDLKGANKPSLKPRIAIVAPTESDGRSSSAEPPMHSGFEPLDTTTDDDEYEGDGSSSSSSSSRENSSRSSTSDQSEFADYVDFGKKDDNSTTQTNVSNRSNNLDDTNNDESAVTLVKHVLSSPDCNKNQQSENKQITCLSSLKTKLGELRSLRDKSEFRLSPQRRGSSSSSNIWRVPMRQWILLHLFILTLHIILNYILFSSRQNNNQHHQEQQQQQQHQSHQKKSDNNFPRFLDDLLDDFGKSIPTSQQYKELELLHSELSQCIKRQSPSSYKYYMSEDRFKDDATPKHNKNYKSYRGLVCYGQESQWRKRFDKLKSKHNLDLRSLMQEAKKRVTNELLEFYHPTLQFKLILNQIEYLDFIETKRSKKQSEELVKYLKAENLQLIRRLNHPNETGYQKLVVSLESENSRLQRENEALKATLGQKAGPIYIKQSIELEQYERENIILKQFHYQVAQDLSKSLKQFNLHTIDASTILDGQESLNSQLMLTRGYLRRLREKIGTVLIENEGLKEELKEVYLLSVTNKANSPAINNASPYGGARHDNNSNALTAGNCTRTLMESRERNGQLESELERMRQECAGCSGGELERCSGRHLDINSGATINPDHQLDLELKQLGAGQETGLNNHARESYPQLDHNDDMMDELMTFLSKFNEQIESHGVAVVDHDHQHHNNAKFDNAGYLGNEKLNMEPKVIPNYIREAVRVPERGFLNKYDDNQARTAEEMNENLNAHIRVPPTPPPIYPSTATLPECSSNASRSSNLAHDDHHQSMNGSQAGVRQNISVETNEVYPKQRPAQDTWFFKRAKQRKQLRSPKMDVNSHNNWMMKRATLREKLRKASSYIDDHYIANGYLRCKNNHKVANSNKYDCKRKHNNSNSKKDEVCKHKRKNNHKQQPRNDHGHHHHKQKYHDYYNDEL